MSQWGDDQKLAAAFGVRPASLTVYSSPDRPAMVPVEVAVRLLVASDVPEYRARRMITRALDQAKGQGRVEGERRAG